MHKDKDANQTYFILNLLMRKEDGDGQQPSWICTDKISKIQSNITSWRRCSNHCYNIFKVTFSVPINFSSPKYILSFLVFGQFLVFKSKYKILLL